LLTKSVIFYCGVREPPLSVCDATGDAIKAKAEMIIQQTVNRFTLIESAVCAEKYLSRNFAS